MSGDAPAKSEPTAAEVWGVFAMILGLLGMMISSIMQLVGAPELTPVAFIAATAIGAGLVGWGVAHR